MFNDQKKTKPSKTNQDEQNRLAAGTVITGNISAEGCFRIEGTLEGDLKTPGKVVISKTGVINGNLECDKADVEGRVSGKITVSDLLFLRSTAILDGQVFTGKLAVEPGATFNATCEMSGGIKTLNKKDEKKSA